MALNLQGKRIIVTGAGRGIGRGIAEKLHELGAKVYAISRTKTYLEELQRKCPGVEIFSVDLEKWDETRKVIASIGLVDGVVNNAAVLLHTSLMDSKPEDFEKILRTNILAVTNVSQTVATEMISKGKGGVIVNVSSNVVNVGCFTLAMYASSKAALDRLTKSMALEWGKHNIRVNSVNPSLTETDMGQELMQQSEEYKKFIERIPLGRILKIEDVIGPVLFLLSDLSKMITGEQLSIDGGYKCY